MAGGGDHSHGGDFRTKVWSMSGGPYCRPVHWKRNTAIALAGIVLVCIPVALKSAELEAKDLTFPYGLIMLDEEDFGPHTDPKPPWNLREAAQRCSPSVKAIRSCGSPTLLQRPHLPVRPIPSQLWCKNFGTKDY